MGINRYVDEKACASCPPVFRPEVVIIEIDTGPALFWEKGIADPAFTLPGGVM